MAAPLRIKAIVVNYNAGDYLRQCTRALSESTLLASICVVDNASGDSSLAGLTEPCQLIRNEVNLGFPRACNQGAQGAAEDFLLFLNPDCFVAPDALAYLVEALDQHPDYAMVGAMIRGEDGREQRACRRNLPTVKRTFMTFTGLERWSAQWPALSGINRSPHDSSPTGANGIEPVDAISGALMLIRRSDFEQIAGFDESYFLHCEDLDLCQRLATADRLIGFVSQAEAVHIKGVTQRSAPLRSQWYKHRNMQRFIQKFGLAGRFGRTALGMAIWLRFLALTPILLWRSVRSGGNA